MSRAVPIADNPERILLIKPSALGDVVHALPVLHLIKKRWPGAKVSWLITPACAGLVEAHPLVDETILFERKLLGKAWRSLQAMRRLRGLVRMLRERKFDLAVDLQGLFRSGWLAKKSKARVRIGFANAREMAWMFYTHRANVPSMETHAVERNLLIARALGCAGDDAPAEFGLALREAERSAVREKLPLAGPYALLFPGTNWMTKRWPAANFAALAKRLKEEGLEAVVAGGADARELAPLVPNAVDLTMKTNLRELAALIAGASLVVANDSGPMHIAAALGRPLTALFGPTNPVRTGPYGRPDAVLRLDIPCAPCYSRKCSHQSCLQWLSVDLAMRHARAQLAAARADAPTALKTS